MDSLPGMWGIALDLGRAELEGATGLTQRQSKRLEDLLAHTRGTSPAYARLYRDLPCEGVTLTDLPVVGKAELMAAFDHWITDPGVTRAGIEAFMGDPAQIATPCLGEHFVCTSSGTTGVPGYFVHDLGAINVYRAIALARIERAWFGAGDWLRMAQRGFRLAAVLGTGGHFAGEGWIELERRRDAWRALSFRVFSVQQPMGELVARLNAFDPAMVMGYPSALELLAEEQAAGRLRLRPALLECSGETLSQGAAAWMSGAFGCPVRSLYSASECLTMAFSCDHDWLHVNSDWVILEPVDEDFCPVSAGMPSHTVLLTNLANRIQPLIRYDLGDSVVLSSDRCGCGNPLPAIRVAGRHDDVLRFVGEAGQSVKILPLAIGTVVEEAQGVQRCQLVQTCPAAVRIRLELEAGMDSEKVWMDVIARLNAYLAEQQLANVELVRAKEPPERSARSGKFRQVIARSESIGR